MHRPERTLQRPARTDRAADRHKRLLYFVEHSTGHLHTLRVSQWLLNGFSDKCRHLGRSHNRGQLRTSIGQSSGSLMSSTTNSESGTLPTPDLRNRLYAKLGLVHLRSRRLRNHRSRGSSMVALRRSSRFRSRQRTKESHESRRYWQRTASWLRPPHNIHWKGSLAASKP